MLPVRPIVLTHTSTPLGLFLIASLVASDAFAGSLLIEAGGQGKEHSYRLVRQRSGNLTHLVEEIEVSVGLKRFAVLKAFPTASVEVRQASPELFDTLAAMTAVERTHRDKVREVMFGPSIVTFLNRHAQETEISPEPSSIQNNRVNFEPRSVRIFEGPMVRTSTGPGAPVTITYPSDFEEWLKRHVFEPDPTQHRIIAQHFDRGDAIVAVVVDAPPTSPTKKLWFGPVVYRYEANEDFYPSSFVGRPIAADKPFTIYEVGGAPAIPQRFEVQWRTQPWRPLRERPEVFYANYHEPMPLDMSIELERLAGLKAEAGTTVVKGRFRFLDPPNDWAKFVQPEATAPPPLIPGNARAGSFIDLLLCMILGLTPLLYTPESWFLLWLASKARETQAFSQVPTAPIGLYLWPIYALCVGAFWGLTQEGAARAAGLIPLLLGGLRLMSVSPDRGKKRVRVDFSATHKVEEPQD